MKAGKSVDEAAASIDLTSKYPGYESMRVKAAIQAIYDELKKKSKYGGGGTMSRGAYRLTLPLLVVVLGLTTAGIVGQSGAKNGEWRTYGGDLGHTRYSPLDQINAGNFSKLEVAWRFKTDNLGPQPEFNLQSTPLMVNGVLYSTGGTRRAVVALDARTGEMLWMYSVDEGKRAEGVAAPAFRPRARVLERRLG